MMYSCVFEDEDSGVTFEMDFTWFEVTPHRGSALTCDSDQDYSGYIEFEVIEIRGQGGIAQGLSQFDEAELQKYAESYMESLGEL